MQLSLITSASGMLPTCGIERGSWELGGDRDAGLGNGCIFNGRESESPEVRPRVRSCIIDKTMDTETLKACVAHTLKQELAHSLKTCQPADVCPCAEPYLLWCHILQITGGF